MAAVHDLLMRNALDARLNAVISIKEQTSLSEIVGASRGRPIGNFSICLFGK